MGRNRVQIDDNHWIVYGYDNPFGGYFAQYYDKNSIQYKEDGEATREIGFFKGVSKNRVLEFLEQHGALDLAKKQTKEAFNNLVLDLPC